MALVLLIALVITGFFAVRSIATTTANAQPADGLPSMATALLGEIQQEDTSFEGLLDGVRCRNAAGHRIESLAAGRRLSITEDGTVIYRWREYGAGQRGSGWTVLTARASLSDLSTANARVNRRFGDCVMLELFCRTEECVTVSRAGSNGAAPRYQSSLRLFATTRDRRQRLYDRLEARLR